jgi:probable phosphoglycerate mutase
MTYTRLILIRHGQSHANVANIVSGRLSCTGLTDRGRDQVDLLARRLAYEQSEWPIAALYSTRLRRTVQTAEIVGQALGLPVSAELREPDYGSAEGRGWTEVISEFGRVPALHPYTPIAARAESWAEYVSRTAHDLAMLSERHEGRNVVVVGHAETVMAASHYFLQLAPERRADIKFVVDHASLTVWQWHPLMWPDFDEERWRWALVCHNDTGHLREEENTALRTPFSYACNLDEGA